MTAPDAPNWLADVEHVRTVAARIPGLPEPAITPDSIMFDLSATDGTRQQYANSEVALGELLGVTFAWSLDRDATGHLWRVSMAEIGANRLRVVIVIRAEQWVRGRITQIADAADSVHATVTGRAA
jgi:hypothetical protein